ncbi:MAG: DUF2461 domain-containing protein [Clostridia bacterium]|nr:DUF2461 domain-containing protein [Clostridia bacterium]
MFQGFSEKTGEFLWELALNNERPWFQAHKEEFETVLNRPLKALGEQMLIQMRQQYPAEDFQLHVSRIYRDARRLFGRGPYKEHMWFSIQSGDTHSHGPQFWFEISCSTYAYGMGFWDATPQHADAFRKTIDANPARFTQLVADIAAYKPFTLWGNEYKRPKGDRGDLLNPWYNRKYISVGYETTLGGAAFDPALPQQMLEDFAALTPMYYFLREVYLAVQENEDER